MDREQLLPEGPKLKCPTCGGVFFIKKTVAESNTNDLVLQINKNGTLLGFKGRLENNLIISTDAIIGKHISDVMTSDIVQPVIRGVEKAIQTGDLQSFEYQHLLFDDHYELKFIDNGSDNVLTVITNISAYKKAAERAKYFAHHDTLTDLPNRYLFNDRLKQAISLVEREKKMLAILFLDLDNFKQINDTIGHRAGDQLLRSVADRLMKCIRTTDSVTHLSREEAESMVARLGGDEFTLLLNKIGNIEEPAIVAGRVLKMLSESFIIGTHEVFVTASMGITVYPFDGTDLDTLLINADVAMYQAKKQGGNCYQYYSESMNKFAF